MNRQVITIISKLFGEVILITMIAGIAIGVIGYLNKWNTTIAYSNAFFIAGSLIAIAGGLSRIAAGQQWSTFQYLYAESFRGMSNSERANFILSASSPVRLVILGLSSGLLLILISVFVVKIF